MKYLFSFLAVVFIAVSAGLLAHKDSGYVLFGRGYDTIEMSLSFFCLFFFLVTYLVICYFALFSVHGQCQNK